MRCPAHRRISRRDFVGESLSAVALLPVGALLPRLFSSKPSRDGVAAERDEQLEHCLLDALQIEPHQIRHYDGLIRLYGRQRRYVDIRELLLEGRRTLQVFAERSPARHARYRTALRLINERLARVEARASGKLAQR